ncbi:AAA family ATPase [Rhodoligotrophos defluvii]|uniref:AAA family ATPase n=1 Tax=Rhodoligotrophos defluvii TaxID=2561934 RepID=UPI0010C965F1|nr:AAA family ATPase [Rhodoligotrophos defluvii]
MQLTSIAVEGVGRFGGRARIDGLGPGVNVLMAANEAGKSTLFRAIRACLFERHSTKNEFVKALASDGLALPVTVTLGFEHEGAVYSLRKSFLKSPAASLRRGDRELARGAQADELVWELLGIARGQGRSMDDAAFGLLWVGQGQSFRLPQPSDGASSVLNAAIQSELGDIVGGERARVVLNGLKAELGRLVTDKGKPKANGPLASAEDRLTLIDDDLAEAERRLAILDQQFGQLAARQRERARWADPAETARQLAALDEARKAHQAAESMAAILAQYEADERQARAVCERERQKLTSLLERADRIDGDRERLRQLEQALKPLDKREKAARLALTEARSALAAVTAEGERLEDEERQLQRIVSVAERAASRDLLQQRQRQLADLARRQQENAAALRANPASTAVIARLDEIERDLEMISARLMAAAPQVSIMPGPAGAGLIQLDGAAVDGALHRSALEPMTIKVGGDGGEIATITIMPAMASLAADRKKQQALQADLAALLAELDFADADALRADRARRQELEVEARSLQAEAKGLGLGQETAAAAAERVGREIEDIEASLARTLSELGLVALSSPEDLERRQAAVQQGRDEIRRKRASLDGMLAAQNEILAGIADQRGRLQGTEAEIRNRFAADLAVLPDEERDQRLGELQEACHRADEAHRLKVAALEAQRRSAPSPEECERLRIRVTRLEEALENRKAQIAQLDREIAHLEGQIQSAGGDGIGEKVETLRAQRDLEMREVERQWARAASLQLLRDTIEDCYKAQRDRLHAPLQRHLRPLVNDVFPAAELALGDGFAVAGLKRAGPEAEGFDRLSAGTQEQIAVLVRLAMGAMLAERGHEVPIVLDDALVYSDDDRIERMFDALNRAGRRQQVIVLTCRMRTFSRLGGNTLSIVQGLD